MLEVTILEEQGNTVNMIMMEDGESVLCTGVIIIEEPAVIVDIDDSFDINDEQLDMMARAMLNVAFQRGIKSAVCNEKFLVNRLQRLNIFSAETEKADLCKLFSSCDSDGK